MNLKRATQITVFALLVLALGLVPLLATQPAEAQSGNQWRMDFFNNSNWQGAPSYTQYSQLINFNWGYGSPAPNVPADYFTGRFTTNAFFYAGTYRFTIVADDEFTLYVDGAQYYSTMDQGQSGKTITLDYPMTQANHSIQIDYREQTQTAYIYATWQYLKPNTAPPTQPTPVPPSGPQLPPSASSVQTKYGDFTPCIQQGLHQAQCFTSDGAWDSPNQGSVKLEPQITVWGNCEPPDSDRTWVIDPNTDPPKTQGYRCSKTLAGYFPK